jgi:hypothetical protein
MRLSLKINLLFFSFLGMFNRSNGQCGSSLSQGKYPSKAFEIVSVLVDACDGSNEGQNEMVRFTVGPSPLNTSDLNVTWATVGNTWTGVCQNTARE